ncbi:MAG: dTMP kinase [Alphaproteobacteria bacterium]|nr:dTMP kinase [Alphaproteobacteria bacterium]MBO6629787.1 dTMP kinase [Alphaproteobacteria bacterium]MDF1625041.1 dTMP kinase [Parvibaculaceae bacterium]
MNQTNPANTGLFITFEGGEGAGKSTQVRRLAAALEAQGRQVLQTREPGGSKGAEQIRTLLVTGASDRWSGMTEALLNFAARSDHLARIIRPALQRGDIVLCDRFADSTMAYQGYAQGVGAAAISALTDIVVEDTRPDLTLIMDLPVEAGLARAAARGEGEDRYEKMGQAFHETLRAAFLDIAARAPKRCVVIDATGSEEAIAEQIMAVIKARFQL